MINQESWTGKTTGRVWRFGDGVNTDEMFPSFAMRMSPSEASQHMFSATRPNWPALVNRGDIVLAGSNMGLGSSRPVPLLFQELGIACVIAVSLNGLFLRSCINYGLPATVVDPEAAEIAEGALIAVDFVNGELIDLDSQKSYSLRRLPEVVVDILRSGGVFNQLESAGLLRFPSHPAPSAETLVPSAVAIRVRGVPSERAEPEDGGQ